MEKASWSARARLGLGWVVLLATIIGALPLLICMPPWVDNTFFDLCARTVLRGRILYRDIFLHGPPGMVLLHVAIRSLLGWRSETLLALDFVIFSGTVWLLVHFLPAQTASRRTWTAFMLFLFYFSLSEWNHGQPDIWMLPLALGALLLEDLQFACALDQAGSRRQTIVRNIGAGVCLGVAFTMKPFVAIPFVPSWAMGAYVVLRLRPSTFRRLAIDVGFVLIGGALVGAAVVGWLWVSGNWHDFAKAALGTWNRDYWLSSYDWRTRTENWLLWLYPWDWIHLLAVPVALVVVVQALVARRAFLESQQRRREAMLAMLYVTWFYQANYLQKQLPYQMVPAIFLALVFLAGLEWAPASAAASWARRMRSAFLVVFVSWAMLYHPFLMYPERFALWGRCFREGSSPELRDALSLEQDVAGPDWRDLERVKEYLSTLNLKDRELTCFSVSAIHLYKEMDLEPSTRFILVWPALIFFQQHKKAILEEVQRSPQRFIVGDAAQIRNQREDGKKMDPHFPFDWPPLHPAIARTFPWRERIVYRAGRYFVHQVRRPVPHRDKDRTSSPRSNSRP